MICPKCNHPNLHGSNFCEKCGADLKAPPPPKVVPVRPYGSYSPPASYAPARPSPAPKPTPAPRPTPAGSAPPRPAPTPPPVAPPAAPPARPAPAAKPEPVRRRSPIVSPQAGASQAQTPAPTPRREPLPYAKITSASGQDFPLRYDENLVGRPTVGNTPQVDLSAVDTSGTVSRRHARIGKDDSSVFIEDLGSSNGTRLNGQTLRAGMQSPLSDGDEIIFGDLIFKFHLIANSG